MNSRCSNPHNKSFKNYGGRGISVDPRWASDFVAFKDYADEHLGPKPSPKHSIDRINNNGNYEPGNLRWATPPQQRQNQRPRISKLLRPKLDAIISSLVDQLRTGQLDWDW
jgi:hypothetical protein